MIARLVAFALHQRFITLALVLMLTAAGLVSFMRLPIEAYPDVGDVEVDVITLWPGHAAEEVERHITLQLEKEPGLPMSADHTDDEIDRVVAAVRAFFGA